VNAVNVLEVLLGTVLVGRLERFEDEEYLFTFDEEWLRLPERPVLGQLFEDWRPRSIPSSGMLCWFGHLLPQGPLRRAIARQFGLDEYDDFDLLTVLGEDLPGAVITRPTTSRLPRRLTESPPPQPVSAGPLRFSLAGAQWKLSVRRRERGLTLAVQGEAGSWIAKFHDPDHPALPRIELATMKWAQACSLDVPPLRQASVSEFVDLPEGIPTGDGTAFLIQRFDRGPEGQRIHMEDMAQVLDRPDQFGGRYEDIAIVLASECMGELREFCARLVFCLLCGNADAHLKNWSFIYPDGRHPRLAPVYDVISTVHYPRIKKELALTLGGVRNFEDIRLDSFRLLAEVAGLTFDEVSTWVREANERVRTAWQEKAGDLPFSAQERLRLEAHMARISLG